MLSGTRSHIAGHLDKRAINRAQAVEIKITKSNMFCVKGSDKIVDHEIKLIYWSIKKRNCNISTKQGPLKYLRKKGKKQGK